MTKSVFNTTKIDMTKEPMFFGKTPNMARYDVNKYPFFDKLTDKQLGFFWRPEEVDISADMKDFRDLADHEKHIFISNLQRQILLDSVQGRSPNLALLPVVSIPELETFIEVWAANETIHSRSYTHIIRNVFTNPSEVFDQIMDKKEIIDDAEEITKHYDDLIEYSTWYQLLGTGTHTVNGKKIDINMRELKRKLYLCIVSINILEGIRFYVSFACSWAFAENKKMEGNAKIIKLICRDENVHLAATQQMLKLFANDDPEMAEIAVECEDEVYQMYRDTVDSEKRWGRYLFKDGSMIGVNVDLMDQFIEHIANRRLKAIGKKQIFNNKQNPLTWTDHWINSANVQVAPQEAEISSYTVGAVDQDLEEETFADMDL